MYWQNNQHTNHCLSQEQLHLLNTLRRLWIEHVMWTRSFIISTAANLKDLDFVTKRLLHNPVDFANLLSQLYGNEKAMKFEKLFTDHLLIAAQLVNSAKAGDTSAVSAHRDKWYANANEIAYFLSEINPYWNHSDWQTMLYDHLKMTEDEAVQILTSKNDASIKEYDSIQKEALKMAADMFYGIIGQFQI